MKSGIDFIVIGGSAGSLQVVLKIISFIADDFSVPILLVLHRNMQSDATLEVLLSAKTNLIVKEVEEKEIISPGHLYFCPSNYHVLVEEDRSFSLDDSERVHYSRPSIDVVFNSAANVFGEKLLCILLSGANSDGAEGIHYAKNLGSTTVVQDISEAEVAYMPEQALKLGKVDYQLGMVEIAGLLNSLEF